MEHHGNFVPWLEVCRITGAKLRIAPLSTDGMLDVERYQALLSPRTRLVAMTAMSNVLGTIVPVKDITSRAHEVGAKVLIDGAQSVPHSRTDVRATGEDLMAFSAHKMLGPTGIGVLYGKREELRATQPFLFGGEMISRVTNEGATWNELPWKFEAGTPVIAEAVGLHAAIDYLSRIGMDDIARHEHQLVEHAFKAVANVPGVRILGPGPQARGGLVSIEMDGIHAHDLASLLNDQGIAIRAGHHCAQPLMTSLGIASTARASFYLYTTTAEIDAFVTALHNARKVFQL
jgi:cysteine desulfurase/selenocysteine lyase